MIFDDYAAYTSKYKAEYGENSIVLMEVGSFWEIYDCNERSGANMTEICGILNIQLSRKNKSIEQVSRTNPLMAGFPSHALDRFMQILLENNYTVVLVGQVTPPPNPKREVVQILSKGTVINEVQSNSNATLYIEGKNGEYNIGIAIIDIITGSTVLYEAYAKRKDNNFSFDELNRIYLIYKFQELSIIGDTDITAKDIVISSGIPSNIKLYDQLKIYDKLVEKVEYQNEVIKLSYNIQSFLTPIEYIECERRPLTLIAFTHLLSFLYKHNKFLIERLQFPEFLENQTYLNLGYNTLEQLDIDLLGKHLNRCKTTPGKRMFEKMLKSPITSIETLESRYDKVDHFRNLGISRISEIRNSILSSVYDLDRLNRRLINRKLNPQEISLMTRSIESIKKLDIVPDAVLKSLDYINSVLDVNKCSKYNQLDDVSENIFISKRYPEIDQLENNLESAMDKMQQHVSDLNSRFKGFFKQEYNDRDGYYLSITNKRFKDIKEGLEIVQQTVVTNYTKIVTSELRDLSIIITKTRQKLSTDIKTLYIKLLQTMAEDLSETIYILSNAVATYDSFMTIALDSIEFNYKRPVLLNNDSGSSFDFIQIRHPLVERIGTDSMYVANDIFLNREDQSGILLFGLNAAGKSTLMKAIGLSIVMAQSGMFVPATNMTLAPYKSIFSRLTKNDDLQRGQSTFMVEMGELRNILKRSDLHSMVIGDEICSGTESTSALAIVAASIQTLTEKRSNFLFATHLHDLSKLQIPEQVKQYHLHVEYDIESERLVYYRDLRPGQGSTLYGIEVCRALKMDEAFISTAIKIRNLLNPSSSPLPKPSTYNKNCFIKKCELCNDAIAEDVHHIKFQSHANDQGFIGHIHMHSKENLIGICETCHHKVHNAQIDIKGKVATSSGVKVQHTVIETTVNNIDIVQRVKHLRNNEKQSYSKIQNMIAIETNSKISVYKIKQMLSSL